MNKGGIDRREGCRLDRLDGRDGRYDGVYGEVRRTGVGGRLGCLL